MYITKRATPLINILKQTVLFTSLFILTLKALCLDGIIKKLNNLSFIILKISQIIARPTNPSTICLEELNFRVRVCLGGVGWERILSSMVTGIKVRC